MNATRPIRAAGPRSPILAYTTLPANFFPPGEDYTLECHTLPANFRESRGPSAEPGGWLTLFGLSADWQD